MKKDLIKRFEQFIRSIKLKDKVAIIHHTDGDGICSGFICAEALERLAHKASLIPKNYSEINSSLIKQLKQKKITKAVVVDIAFDQHPEIIKKINKFCDVLIIDHHLEYDGKNFNNIQNKHTITIKQTLLGINYYYPASKLAYDLFCELIDISDLDWIVACGVIADMGYQPNKEFVDKVLKKYNYNELEYGKGLAKIADYISYSGVFKPNKISLAIQALKKAKEPRDLLDSKLAKLGEKIQKKVDYWIDYIKQNAEKYDDLMLCEIKSKERLKGTAITILSREYPHTTIIVYQADENKFAISARRHDHKVGVNELLEKATKGFCIGFAGGHKPAAGAVILKKDLNKFKDKIKQILKK